MMGRSAALFAQEWQRRWVGQDAEREISLVQKWQCNEERLWEPGQVVQYSGWEKIGGAGERGESDNIVADEWWRFAGLWGDSAVG